MKSVEGWKKLFDYVVNGKVNVVVVSYKDRLTRFGFKYLEEFFSSHGVRIEVVFGEEPKDLQQELVEDLIVIVTSFAGGLYGMRSHKKKMVVESVKQAIRVTNNTIYVSAPQDQHFQNNHCYRTHSNNDSASLNSPMGLVLTHHKLK